MCGNCNIVDCVFTGAKTNPDQNFIPVYRLLSVLVSRGQLRVYAGDCPFERMVQVLEEETHFTVCFYLQCVKCGELYFFGACIRGTPRYEKAGDVSPEKIETLLWGREGVYNQEEIRNYEKQPGARETGSGRE